MTRPRAVALSALVLVLATGRGATAEADGLSGYRAYTLGDSLASVVAASGADRSDVKIEHERPGLIQELEWRAPYADPAAPADPVHTIAFRFCDDRLYQITVTYDRRRTEGLADQDIVDGLTGTYGLPVLATAGSRGTGTSHIATGTTVLARWVDSTSRVTLSKDVSWGRYQLVLLSTSLEARALSVIAESRRLTLDEAPQRARDLQRQAALEAERTRAANKSAFRP